MRDLVDQLKVLADESRLKLLFALEKKDACVCELASFLKLTQPTVSSHLKLLRQAGWVDYTKDGKWVNYALTRDPQKLRFLAELRGMIPDIAALEEEIGRINGVCRETLK